MSMEHDLCVCVCGGGGGGGFESTAWKLMGGWGGGVQKERCSNC